MNRYQRDTRKDPPLPPVERVSLSGEHSRTRIVLLVCFLALGLASIGYGVHLLLNRQPGWTEIEARSDAEPNCAWELSLQYDLTGPAEAKLLTQRYTDLAVYAYRCFHAGESFAGVGNLRSVNDAPNEVVTVEPPLYRALETLEASGSRALYLAPVYEIYVNLFCSVEDHEAEQFDPRRNAESAAYIEEALPYVNDPAAVQLELLGNDQVCLHVSQTYLDYAAANEIGAFVDLYWMKAAFEADCIADALAADGYTRGYLSSRDGFCRNLYAESGDFRVSVYSGAGRAARLEGELALVPPVSVVRLRDWSTEQDVGDYVYTYADGESSTAYIDPADGLCRSAVPELVCYASDRGCGELLAEVLTLYVADTFDESRAQALADRGICVFCYRNGAPYHTGSAALHAGADGR